MFSHLVGKYSTKVKNQVERAAVKKFAEAIGDFHPIYADENTGATSMYRRNMAPPTFPVVFDYGMIDGFDLSTKGLIHGEQTFHYERPLLIGEELFCSCIIEKYTEKKSSKGTLGILMIKNLGEDLTGNLLFTSKMTIIITEEVRKGLSH
jgi:hypothetical protein